MVIFSTRDSIDNDIWSWSAIIETVLALGFFFWIAIRYETYLLLFSAFAALLVLLRSDESVALGSKWFTRWENNTDHPEDSSHGTTLLRRVTDAAVSIPGRAAIGFVVAYLIAWQFLVEVEGWKLFLGSAVIVWVSTALATGIVSVLAASSKTVVFGGRDLVALAGTQLPEVAAATAGTAAAGLATLGFLIPTGAAAGAVIAVVASRALRPAAGAAAIIGALFFALIGAAAAVTVWGPWGIAGALAVGPTVYGSAAGVLFVSIIIRIGATFCYLWSGIKSLPRNFRRLWLCTSPIQPPELVPGLKEGETRFTFQHLWAEFRNKNDLLGYAISSILLCAWFAPGWVYRFTLKSTAWVWWPVAFILDEPKLAKTPAWQYKAMVGTLIGWIAISISSYTDAVFFLTKFVSRFWGEGFPDNPFLTPFGYFFVLDWSGKFWPIFSIVGPTLSIVTLVWLNRTFTKHQIATNYKYEELLREAERTFPIIERVQRVQLVLLILYCLLVVGQFALYVNSQKCLVSIGPNMQSLSDWLFGDKSPHPQCDARHTRLAATAQNLDFCIDRYAS